MSEPNKVEKSYLPRIKDNIGACFSRAWSMDTQLTKLERTIIPPDGTDGEEDKAAENPIILEITNDTARLVNYLDSLLERLTIYNGKTIGEE